MSTENTQGKIDAFMKKMGEKSENTSEGSMFNRYKKADGKSRILLLYLILNNYDLDKVEKVVEVVQPENFGLEFRRIYGETTEYVDVKAIDAELAKIRVPIICSPQSYEINSTAEIIHAYRPKIPERPLYINDMGVISPMMIITEDCIVSSNIAASVENSKEKGFMYFVDYVLKGECKVGNWVIEYKDKERKSSDTEHTREASRGSTSERSELGEAFLRDYRNELSIFYCTERDGEVHKELLYQAIELDQTSSFKLVLYIISKAASGMDEFPPDNFTEETYRLENKV